MVANVDPFEEIKANQRRLEMGLTVVSEMVERLLAQVEAVGFSKTELKFRGYQPEPSRDVQAVRRPRKENSGGAGAGNTRRKANRYRPITP